LASLVVQIIALTAVQYNQANYMLVIDTPIVNDWGCVFSLSSHLRKKEK